MELKGKDLIAYRTAHFFKDGDIVNLGIGMPTKCLDYLPEGVDIWIDSENGVVGLTGAPAYAVAIVLIMIAGVIMGLASTGVFHIIGL